MILGRPEPLGVPRLGGRSVVGMTQLSDTTFRPAPRYPVVPD